MKKRGDVYILLSLVMLLIMLSCDNPVSKGRKLYRAYFRKELKDRDFFKVYRESYTKEGDYTINWVLVCDAKNSFGGRCEKR